MTLDEIKKQIGKLTQEQIEQLINWLFYRFADYIVKWIKGGRR